MTPHHGSRTRARAGATPDRGQRSPSDPRTASWVTSSRRFPGGGCPPALSVATTGVASRTGSPLTISAGPLDQVAAALPAVRPCRRDLPILRLLDQASRTSRFLHEGGKGNKVNAGAGADLSRAQPCRYRSRSADIHLQPQGRPCGRPPAAAVLGRQHHGDQGGTPQCLTLRRSARRATEYPVDNDAGLLMESAT
jgi:hypothetical protein